MFLIASSKRFKKSLRKLQRSGKLGTGIRTDLQEALDFLARGERLPASFEDHQLQGELKKYRECHIRGDLLLVYTIVHERSVVTLEDIGSHSQIFG